MEARRSRFSTSPASHYPSGLAAALRGLVRIWVLAIPGADSTHREELIERYSQCPGFRCLTANYDDDIVGFTYGLHHGQGSGRGGPGEIASVGSHDLIQEKITAGLVQPDWLDAFDIADLQVLPEYRRQGIGEGLVRALCDSLPPAG